MCLVSMVLKNLGMSLNLETNSRPEKSLKIYNVLKSIGILFCQGWQCLNFSLLQYL